MLLYEDYFSYNTSPLLSSSSGSLNHCSKLDARIYDIIFLPSSYIEQSLKQQQQQSASIIQYIDNRLVSYFKGYFKYFCFLFKFNLYLS